MRLKSVNSNQWCFRTIPTLSALCTVTLWLTNMPVPLCFVCLVQRRSDYNVRRDSSLLCDQRLTTLRAPSSATIKDLTKITAAASSHPPVKIPQRSIHTHLSYKMPKKMAENAVWVARP